MWNSHLFISMRKSMLLIVEVPSELRTFEESSGERSAIKCSVLRTQLGDEFFQTSDFTDERKTCSINMVSVCTRALNVPKQDATQRNPRIPQSLARREAL